MKWIVIGIVAFVVMAVGATAFFFLTNDPGFSNNELEECVTLRESSPSASNFVIFSEKKEEAEKYMNFLSDFGPFNNYKDDFNFYYIGSYKPKCETYKGIALLCYSRELVKKAASCPNDFIVVLNDDYGSSMRSSNYVNVMSINVEHPPTVLPHEFGHSFVNFAEEYVPATIPRNSAGNCVRACDDFIGDKDGCYPGCSEATYYRSIENGIMRTLRAATYGIFNEGVVIKKILSLRSAAQGFGITAKVVDNLRNCADEYSTYIGVRYFDGKLVLEDKFTVHGCGGGLKGEGPHSVRVKGEEIGKANFYDVFTESQGPNDEVIEGEIFFAGDVLSGKDILIPLPTELESFSPPENIEGRSEPGFSTPEIIEEPGSEGGGSGENTESTGGENVQEPEKVNVEIADESTGEKTSKDFVLCKSDLTGDANGDGVVNPFDLALARLYFETELSPTCFKNIDMNGDGDVNVADVKLLEALFTKTYSSTPTYGGSPGGSSPSGTGTPSASGTGTPTSSGTPSGSGTPSPSTSSTPAASGSSSSSASPTKSIAGYYSSQSFYQKLGNWITGFFVKG